MADTDNTSKGTDKESGSREDSSSQGKPGDTGKQTGGDPRK